MCVPLLSAALSAGANIYGATADTTGMTGAETTAMAGNVQAIAGAADAIGNLAMAQTRARLARMEAAGEAATGAQRADRIRRQGRLAVGEARAAAVGSGVKLTGDSVMEAERELMRRAEQDAGVAILTGANRARSLNMSADYMEQAGTASLLASGAEAFGNWRRTRPMPVTTRRPYNPGGDGFVSDPYAGP